MRFGSMKRVASAVGEAAGALQNVHRYVEEWANAPEEEPQRGLALASNAA